MGRCPGRAWAYAAAVSLAFDALIKPALAYGQDDEVIVDPELSGPTAAPAATGADGDEVIEDPELTGGGAGKAPAPRDFGWGEVYKKPGEEPGPRQASGAEPDTMANTGIARIEVVGQTAIDMHRENGLEDFYEARLRFAGEVDFRVTRKLRLSLGTRLDFAWYAPHQKDTALQNVPVYAPSMDGQPPQTVDYKALDQDRYEVDIVPLSAYVDGDVGDAVHLRVGTQVISLGRMDGLSTTDMLAVYDFRPQAKADPAGLKLAQPAVRLDWDLSSWATLQAVYVPWFMPHLMRPNRDRYVQGALNGVAPATTAADGLGNSALGQAVDQLIEPSWQTRASEASLHFVGPAPDFAHPQAELRINFRGNSFELALLGGTALEKLPSIYYTPVVQDVLLTTGGDNSATLAQYLGEGYPVFDVEYHRYYLFGFDGSFDISPIQISFEFGFSPERHLYTQGRGSSCEQKLTGATKNSSCDLPLPNVSAPITDPVLPGANMGKGVLSNVTNRSIRKGASMLQAALHAEYIKEEQLAIIAEGYLFQALERPYNQGRDWLGFREKSGTYIGGLVAASYALAEGKYRFEASCLAMMGPSFVLTPQFEVEVIEGLYLNVGAQIYEGPTPNNYDPNIRGFVPGRTATNLTMGGVFSGYDNVYLGFRWIP
jgi:hypothetical protein